MAPRTELTALAQEIMEMDSETFEITDYQDADDTALAIQLSDFCSTCSTSSCSSTA